MAGDHRRTKNTTVTVTFLVTATMIDLRCERGKHGFLPAQIGLYLTNEVEPSGIVDTGG